jgi:hypothetical protein
LGHSLHAPFAERLKVKLCNRFPFLFPASYFTFHPTHEVIVSILNEFGAKVKEVTQSQMPNLKRIMNMLDWSEPESEIISNKIVELEKMVFDYLKDRADSSLLEEILPTITVAATKRL